MDTVADRAEVVPATRMSRVTRADGLPLSDEAPVTIVLNDREVATLMCTPRHLRELTVGWLFAEGLIHGPEDIVGLAGCAHAREMIVQTVAEPFGSREERSRLITSGCGAVTDLERLYPSGPPPVLGDIILTPARLRELVRQMLRDSELYHATGGVHSAALAAEVDIVVQREDIGRHNAVDKAVGYGLLNGLDFSRLALLASGRLSSEMVWKAARAGIPLVASLSVPSTLACDLAEAAGLTLVGRAARAEPLVYTRPDRIITVDSVG